MIVGDEELLVSRAVAQVVHAARATGDSGEVTEIDAEQLTAEDLQLLVAPSLFGEQRVLVLAGAQNLDKDATAAVEAYVADPLDEVALVVVHSGGAKNKKLLELLSAAGARRVDCAKLTKRGDRLRFIEREFRAANRPVTEAAANALLDAVGNELRELAAACSQLLNDTAGPVDVDAVARYHRGRAEVSGFTIADATVDGNVGAALESLRWGLTTGLVPLFVTKAIGDSLRQIVKVAEQTGQSSAAIAATLRMPPWKVESLQRRARGWRPDSLATALCSVATADAAIKGAGSDVGYALERLVLEVTSARGAR